MILNHWWKTIKRQTDPYDKAMKKWTKESNKSLNQKCSNQHRLNQLVNCWPWPWLYKTAGQRYQGLWERLAGFEHFIFKMETKCLMTACHFHNPLYLWSKKKMISSWSFPRVFFIFHFNIFFQYFSIILLLFFQLHLFHFIFIFSVWFFIIIIIILVVKIFISFVIYILMTIKEKHVLFFFF